MTTLFSNPFYGYKIYSKYLMPYRTYCKIFKAKTITDLPQEFLQILINIILSFLIRIYEPMIITANCELTLTDRWYFCEPNKISLTIFGQLRNLLRFIEVQFKTKINKHVYSLEIKKTEFSTSAQHARLGQQRRVTRASAVWPTCARSPAGQRPATGEKARMRRHHAKTSLNYSVFATSSTVLFR